MKRLFVISYLIIVVTFFIAIIAMDESALFSTDDWDEVNLMQDVNATRYLLTEIADSRDQAYAETALANYARKMQFKTERFAPTDPVLSNEMRQKIAASGVAIEDLDFGTVYFTFGDQQHIYKVEIDDSADFWREESKLEMLMMLEICTALAILTFIVLFLLSRRLHRLEKVCVDFANGDLDVRARTSILHEVGDLNRTFNFMADRISQLIRSNRNLTNAVAHEFRTPIFRIQCNLDMLDDSRVRQEQMPYLEGMQGDLNELCSMVEELLHFSKMERLDAQLALEETDIHALMTEQLNHLQFETDIKLTLMGDDPCCVPVSVHLFQRAVGNIIRNGYKYAQTEVRVSLKSSSSELHISIENDGPDIPVKDREAIFEPFTRLDKARDRQSGGHGLGLAITDQIIKQHKGRVYITDSAMGGPCFNIQLPLSALE